LNQFLSFVPLFLIKNSSQISFFSSSSSSSYLPFVFFADFFSLDRTIKRNDEAEKRAFSVVLFSFLPSTTNKQQQQEAATNQKSFPFLCSFHYVSAANDERRTSSCNQLSQ